MDADMITDWLWAPPAVPSLLVRGLSARLPINCLFFAGRNYHPLAAEMGRPVDKSKEVPFYFNRALRIEDNRHQLRAEFQGSGANVGIARYFMSTFSWVQKG